MAFKAQNQGSRNSLEILELFLTFTMRVFNPNEII